MRRRDYLASLALVGGLGGCLGSGPASTPSPVPVRSTPTATRTETPTPDPTPTATATPSIGQIDEPVLKAAIIDAIAAARGASITHEGSLSDSLSEMASYHSDRMARERTVAQEIDGESTSDRYEEYDLDCRFRDNEGTYLYHYEDYEIVGSVSTRGVTPDQAAERLVDGWLENSETAETLLLENASHLGIGVTIVTGRAYVTIVYC